MITKRGILLTLVTFLLLALMIWYFFYIGAVLYPQPAMAQGLSRTPTPTSTTTDVPTSTQTPLTPSPTITDTAQPSLTETAEPTATGTIQPSSTTEKDRPHFNKTPTVATLPDTGFGDASQVAWGLRLLMGVILLAIAWFARAIRLNKNKHEE